GICTGLQPLVSVHAPKKDATVIMSKSRNALKLVVAALALGVLAGMSGGTAVAATYTWDTSVSAGFQSGSGTWGTSNFWSTLGTDALAWTASSDAVFANGNGGASAITVTGTQ